MSNISLRDPDTVTAAERGREFWHGVLLAGGSTTLPRWTLEPVPGVGEHERRIPDKLVAGLRRLAKKLAGAPRPGVLTAPPQGAGGPLGGRRGWAWDPRGGRASVAGPVA